MLETGATVAPERVWSWIGWTREADGEGEVARALRARIVAHVLLAPGVGGTRLP